MIGGSNTMVIKRRLMAVKIRPPEGDGKSQVWAAGLPDLAHRDWKLSEGSTWIAVGNITVYIIRTEEGVVISTMPLGMEDISINTLSGCYAAFAQAAELGASPVRKGY
jgi:hypothetical protein